MADPADYLAMFAPHDWIDTVGFKSTCFSVQTCVATGMALMCPECNFRRSAVCPIIERLEAGPIFLLCIGVVIFPDLMRMSHESWLATVGRKLHVDSLCWSMHLSCA